MTAYAPPPVAAAPEEAKRGPRVGLAAALRIARRDALRAKGRSFLIVAMVALPVMALAFAAVAWRTAELNPDEQLDRQLGQASYRFLSWSSDGSSITQTPDGDVGSYSAARDGEPVDIEALVPTGARALTETSDSVTVRTRTGLGSVGWTETEAADPAMAGRWALDSGRGPQAAGEVLLTPKLADRAGLAEGDTLTVTEPEAAFTVVGIAHRLADPHAQEVVALPGALAEATGNPGFRRPLQSLWVVDAPITWDRILELNELGVAVLSREVAENPPPRSEVPFYADPDNAWANSNSELAFTILAITVVVVLACLEVILLAGAAFAVGARRQARTLALVVAVGGDRRDARRVVLAGGLVLGLVAGAVGVVLGCLLALAAVPVLHHVGSDTGRYDLRPLEVLPIVLVGVLTGVLAAVVPARAAARQDVVATLAGRRNEVHVRRRVPVIGVLTGVLGVVAAGIGSAVALAADDGMTDGTAYVVAGLIAGGAVLAILGLVVLSPTVVALAGRLAHALPLSPRLAVRDAARHRARTAPAVAAVLVAVSGSVALSFVVQSFDDHDRREYRPSLPDRFASVGLVTTSYDAEGDHTTRVVPAADVERAVAAQLPVADVIPLRVAGACVTDRCPQANLVTPEANRCPDGRASARDDDWRCVISHLSTRYSNSTSAVGDAALAERLGVQLTEQERDVLASGGVLLNWRAQVEDGRATYELFGPDALDQEPPPGQEATWTGPQPDERVTVPAAWVQDLPFASLMSERTADRLGIGSTVRQLALRLDRVPTQGEEDAAAAALEQFGLGPYDLSVERGYRSSYGPGLLALVLASAVITLGAAGVATGLALADARPDHATLAAVGAAPRVRRWLAAAQALTITLLGTLLGVLAGLVPGIAFVRSLPDYDLVAPWLSLLAIIGVVPLLAGGVALLLTRGRLPMTRREAV
ncbi:FtsX-like permease family protein [Motilibacter aurantiacus]|uniref:FtsX-like permease family protein n=1 Tax=Motilibacter aurantiacus TaxID=2714955 RepID=UPI001407BE26|nr:FtsX-like permease family protein [Motilibacter aurantiacus]NHC45185.1 FtsX-like permease family protein [Motilibacter aurantiacus]